MSHFHVVAVLPGGAQKTVMNKAESDVMTGFIVPFIKSGTITTQWGKNTQRRQALELRVYKTNKPFDKKLGVAFADFVKSKQNVYSRPAKRAEAQRASRLASSS